MSFWDGASDLLGGLANGVVDVFGGTEGSGGDLFGQALGSLTGGSEGGSFTNWLGTSGDAGGGNLLSGLAGGLLGGTSGGGDAGGGLGSFLGQGASGFGGGTDGGSWGDTLGGFIDSVSGGDGDVLTGIAGGLLGSGGDGNLLDGLTQFLPSEASEVLAGLGGSSTFGDSLLGSLSGSSEGLGTFGDLAGAARTALGNVIGEGGVEGGLGGLVHQGLGAIGDTLGLEPGRLADLGRTLAGEGGGSNLADLATSVFGSTGSLVDSVDGLVGQLDPSSVATLVDAAGTEGLAGLVGGLSPDGARDLVAKALEGGDLDHLVGALRGGDAASLFRSIDGELRETVFAELSPAAAKAVLADIVLGPTAPTGPVVMTTVPMSDTVGDDAVIGDESIPADALGTEPVDASLAGGVPAHGDDAVEAVPTDAGVGATPDVSDGALGGEPASTPSIDAAESEPAADTFDQAISAADQVESSVDDLFDGVG